MFSSWHFPSIIPDLILLTLLYVLLSAPSAFSAQTGGESEEDNSNSGGGMSAQQLAMIGGGVAGAAGLAGLICKLSSVHT